LLASVYGVGLDSLMQFYPGTYSVDEIAIGEAVQHALSLPYRPYCVRGSEKVMERVGQGLIYGNTVTCLGFFGPQGRMVRIKPAIPDIIERLSQVRVKNMVITISEVESAVYYTMGRLLGHEGISLNAIVDYRITRESATDHGQIIEHLILCTLKAI